MFESHVQKMKPTIPEKVPPGIFHEKRFTAREDYLSRDTFWIVNPPLGDISLYIWLYFIIHIEL